MPRGRMLNKKISQDEKVARLSVEATLLYTWCIPFLDFRGRIYGDLWTLKAIVPHIKEITPRKIKRIRQEWVDADLVVYYGNEKQKYLNFKGFSKNQTLKEGREAESEIPPPTQELLRSYSGVTPTKEKLSKDKISKDKISKVSKRPVDKYVDKSNKSTNTEYFPKPTQQQKKELVLLHTKLKNLGFDIFIFIQRARNQKGYFPPVNIILKIGTVALRTKPKNLWAYFTGALKKELPKCFADLNIQETRKFKQDPMVIGDILKKWKQKT